MVQWCVVGDKIETTMSDGKRIVMVLNTLEAAAYANSLIVSGRWNKVESDNNSER